MHISCKTVVKVTNWFIYASRVVFFIKCETKKHFLTFIFQSFNILIIESVIFVLMNISRLSLFGSFSQTSYLSSSMVNLVNECAQMSILISRNWAVYEQLDWFYSPTLRYDGMGGCSMIYILGPMVD